MKRKNTIIIASAPRRAATIPLARRRARRDVRRACFRTLANLQQNEVVKLQFYFVTKGS